MSVEIDVAEFEKDLNDYINNKLPNELEKRIEKACLLVEGTAKELAPKDLGQLSSSIATEVERKGGNIEGYVSANTEYALFVHEGTGIYAKNGGRKTPWFYKNREGKTVRTVGQKPKPFLKDALLQNKDKIIKILKD